MTRTLPPRQAEATAGLATDFGDAQPSGRLNRVLGGLLLY
jgi:hypothetical protein